MGTPCKHYRPSLVGHTAIYAIGPQVCPWCKIESLESKLAALEADARRYRWLRNKGDTGMAVDVLDEFYGVTRLKMGAELDAALDAALSQEPGGK